MNFPKNELPRERLMRDGIDALSLPELLAILLGTGTQGKNVLALSQELIFRFGGIEGLLDASLEELKSIKGIGEAKAVTLKAAFGIARRAAQVNIQRGKVVKPGRQMYDLAKHYIGHLKKEALFIALRDIKERLIHSEIINLGTLNEVPVHPREVFEPALRHGAHTIMLAHNHPSGDPNPSRADIALTGWLCESAKIMGIAIAEHVIVGQDSFYSIRLGTAERAK